MSMIVEVARLKELEEKATPGIWDLKGDQIENETNWIGPGIDDEDYKLLVALRNAAPAMLDVLGHIQPGDASMLEYLVSEQENEDPDSEDRLPDEAIDMLKRLQAVCQKMEEP